MPITDTFEFINRIDHVFKQILTSTTGINIFYTVKTTSDNFVNIFTYYYLSYAYLIRLVNARRRRRQDVFAWPHSSCQCRTCCPKQFLGAGDFHTRYTLQIGIVNSRDGRGRKAWARTRTPAHSDARTVRMNVVGHIDGVTYPRERVVPEIGVNNNSIASRIPCLTPA